MSRRPDVTGMLSDLVAKRLTSQNQYWAAEVNFDKNTQNERRIDFVSFKPYTPSAIVEPTSVELGTFECYEIKSSWADFTSGHGLTFYGDDNWLVCEQDLAMEILREAGRIPNLTGILCPDKSGTRLYKRHQFAGTAPHRRRPASEMLWAICQSHNRERSGTYVYHERGDER